MSSGVKAQEARTFDFGGHPVPASAARALSASARARLLREAADGGERLLSRAFDAIEEFANRAEHGALVPLRGVKRWEAEYAAEQLRAEGFVVTPEKRRARDGSVTHWMGISWAEEGSCDS